MSGCESKEVILIMFGLFLADLLPLSLYSLPVLKHTYSQIFSKVEFASLVVALDLHILLQLHSSDAEK